MFTFSNLSHPYPITRNASYATNGMVATSQSLAAEAGLEVMKKGGNAIDAAIATAACLTVVEPTSNGIGGDAFALIWTKGKLHGLNGSGRSPKSLSIGAVKEAGYTDIPTFGWIPVTVPGAPGAWAELAERFGNLPLTESLKPAIMYAEEGYPVSPTLSKYWKKAYTTFKEELTDTIFHNWFEVFAPKGRIPKAGEVWSSPDHARTLRLIAETNAQSFYKGELAEEIALFSKNNAGYLTLDDLAGYTADWVDPIHINYRGYDIWEIPPNGQGIIALQALNMLKGFQFNVKDSVHTYHKQIEAMKLAFSDGNKYITEACDMTCSTADILNDQYAEQRRKLIKEEACIPEAGEPSQSGTVYLATADKEGNMVSFIQSNYKGFGSGIVVPGTGIALQNRGKNFSMDPNHVNALKGGKRTFHTIIPGFLTKGLDPVGPFSVMGGTMQPQGHVQLIMNTIDFGLNPQAALDAPRWRWIKDKTVEVEHRFSHHIAESLADKGHDIRFAMEPNNFGRGQIIWRNPETGVLVGGSDSRTDSTVASW